MTAPWITGDDRSVPTVAVGPAAPVPVAAKVRVVGWDHDHVTQPRGDFTIAARAPVGLGGVGRLDESHLSPWDVRGVGVATDGFTTPVVPALPAPLALSLRTMFPALSRPGRPFGLLTTFA